MFISVFFSAIQFHQFIQLTSSWTNCLNEQYTHKHNNNSQCVRIGSDAVWILWISFLFVCIQCSNDRWWKAIWKWFIICLFIPNNWNFELLFSVIHLLCKVYLSAWRPSSLHTKILLTSDSALLNSAFVPNVFSFHFSFGPPFFSPIFDESLMHTIFVIFYVLLITTSKWDVFSVVLLLLFNYISRIPSEIRRTFPDRMSSLQNTSSVVATSHTPFYCIYIYIFIN